MTNEHDDLTVIKGIGQTRKQWFKSALKVETFADLAACETDEVEARMKAEGLIVSRHEISEWIATASEILSKTPKSAKPNVKGRRKNANGGGEWKPFASFVVEFQVHRVEGKPDEYRTTVHYMEADKSENWAGIQNERLCQWLVDQLPKTSSLASAEDHGEKIPPAPVLHSQPQHQRLRISNVEIRQPDYIGMLASDRQANVPLVGFVKSNEPFSVQAMVQLGGIDASDFTIPMSGNVQFSAIDLATGGSLNLGNTETFELIRSQSSYQAVLPEASLPAGMYRLRVVASLHGISPSTSYFEVPLVQAV